MIKISENEKISPEDKFYKNFLNDFGKIFLENTLEYAVDKFKEAYPRLKEKWEIWKEKFSK